jgi:hypothetical protein
MKIDENTIIPLIDKDDVECFVPYGETPYGICTDYTAIL